MGGDDETRPHVVAVDYGNKRNIFRNLVEAGARVTVVPATATFDEIMAHEPEGFFLSNGPGDPAATGVFDPPTRGWVRIPVATDRLRVSVSAGSS